MNTTLTFAASILGTKAFSDNMPCVPAYDSELLNLMQGLKAGEGKAVLKAWLNAWNLANAL